MNKFLLACALTLVACKVKVDDQSAGDPPLKPAPCQRAIKREIPTEFRSLGTPVATVQTAACETLVVGHDDAGETIIAKFNPEGRLETAFADHGVLRPLATTAAARSLDVRVQRLAVINEGFFALGSYTHSFGSRAFFAFRFLDSGFLDIAFGPLRDGTISASADERWDLVSIGTPVIDGEMVRMPNRFEDRYLGAAIEREEVFVISGAEAMPKDLAAIPGSCEILNHSAYKEDTQYQISQNDCARMNWQTRGPAGSDLLSIEMNGSPAFSNVIGEMRWFYEGGNPVLLSRNSMGFVRRDYAQFVQGQSVICGESVDARRRYLVFSPRLPADPSWLEACWFF